MTTFYCLRFETPLTCRARSPYLYLPGKGWPGYTSRHWVPFSPASYDSQGYGGGIRSRLHADVFPHIPGYSFKREPSVRNVSPRHDVTDIKIIRVVLKKITLYELKGTIMMLYGRIFILFVGYLMMLSVA
jgi:hypothetical protein